jgi:NTE family protein
MSDVVHCQRVGLVLSGGGATGLAHIGVIKALEEAEIPIDYIAGTSAGALVAGMYVSGMSPAEIEAYVLSDNFLKMASGEVSDEKSFYLKAEDINAGMLSVPFSGDSIFKKSLPTNFITPTFLDYEMFRVFARASAAANENFDSLMIPFRCVASDIQHKKSVVFTNGKLNKAIRASMTYPFYMNPIRVDGQLMFDGGLYNNFPADALYESFDLDFIIGSNVSGVTKPPKEDDLLSQVRNMLVTPSNFELPCENGVLIEPTVSIGTFNFADAKLAIDDGYQKGKIYIDSIRRYVSRKVSQEEMARKRNAFQSSWDIPLFDEVNVISLHGNDLTFIENSIIKEVKDNAIDFDEFTKRYFRVAAAPQVKYIYPTLEKKDSTYRINLEVTKQKPFLFSDGGHFSSRPVNTGYLGFSYLNMANAGMKIHADTYFGKFYGSSRLKMDIDIPAAFPFRVSPYFLMNRWDYFRSFATFFEDVRPSFLVQNEMYYGVKLASPLGNKYVSDIDFRGFTTDDEYYQNLNFNNQDTTDQTNFEGQSIIIGVERNSLNRKQWASEGKYFRGQFRYVQGKERSVSGSTSLNDYDLRRMHRWINLSLEGQVYPISNSVFSLGFYGKGVINSQSLFSNYTATLLTMTEFTPLPDSKTLFLEDYRAPQYVGGGTNLIFKLKKLVDIRLDAYLFQPFKRIERFEDGQFGFAENIELGTYMFASSVIFHSPIGPLRLTANYFPKESRPLMVQLSFGYVLFNSRAIR